MGRLFLEEDLLDSTGVYRVGSPLSLVGWGHAYHVWTGWSVEEVNLSGTVLNFEGWYAHILFAAVTTSLPAVVCMYKFAISSTYYTFPVDFCTKRE